MKIFDELIQVSKALSDENRIKIVTLVQREKALCVCEISDTLKLSQPLVSRYLKQLKEAHILSSSKERKWVIYKMTEHPSELLESYLGILKENENRIDALVTCDKRS